ncbi:MAG: hypothetical protein UZ11_BCD004001605 [Bacteroidetes bacterium OLB11]|nr:MAG: hypothetical protein UZ11_BCD004001605 [Bacteroidetes bacterium OLB11]
MNEEIVISGMGIYSALGLGLQNNFFQLSQSRDALSSLEFLDTIYQNEYPFGEIKKSTSELKSDLGISTEKNFY